MWPSGECIQFFDVPDTTGDGSAFNGMASFGARKFKDYFPGAGEVGIVDAGCTGVSSLVECAEACESTVRPPTELASKAGHQNRCPFY